MSDEIKTNDIVEETVETDVPETEAEETVETTEIDNAEEQTDLADGAEETVEESADDKPAKKSKKDAFFKINPKTGKKKLRGWLIALIAVVTSIAVITSAVFITLAALAGKMQGSAEGVPAPDGYDISFYTFDEDFYARYNDYTEQLEGYSELLAKCVTVRGEDGEIIQEPTATDEEMALAAWIIYRVASKADFNAPEKAKYSTGGGYAGGKVTLPDMFDAPLEVGGGMNMTSTYFTILDGTDKYVAQEEYTQFPAGSIKASDDSLVFVGEACVPSLLAFARRGIVTPEKTVTWNGENDSSVITDNGVTGKFKDNKNRYKFMTAAEAEEAASVYERIYPETWGDEYGGTAPDLSLHVINPDTIKANTVVIYEVTEDIQGVYKLDKEGNPVLDDEGNKVLKYTKAVDKEGNTIKYYAVEFEVDPEAIVGQLYDENGELVLDEDGNPIDVNATYYAEQLYLSNGGGLLAALGRPDLSYGKLVVNMSVFGNGYIRGWTTDETWIMSADITNETVVDMAGAGSNATLISENYSEEYYTYNHEIIMQGFVNRWIGDSKNVGMPMSDLPFADKLAGYEKQSYGSYR